MNYDEAIQYISRTNRFGMKLGLETVEKLLELLGDPHKKLKIIHVAGTNGKGSVCSFVSKILEDAGYKVGLYTSPFLERFTERIRINGIEIPESEVARIITIVEEIIPVMLSEGYDNPTEFEIVTAMAFYYYNYCKVDYVVLEVGLGGRYDATNIIDNSLVSVITSISLDHIGVLGDTISKIAYEKSGIIKEDGSVVVYKQQYDAEKVIKDICNSKHATFYDVEFNTISVKSSNINSQVFDYTSENMTYRNVEIKLIGEHQIRNAVLAINVIEVLNNKYDLKIGIDNIKRGLTNTIWPGRIEIINDEPLFIIDGAHNLDGAKSLAKVVRENFSDRKSTLVIGMLKDKAIDEVLEVLIPLFDNIIATYPISDRSLDEILLKEKISKIKKNVVAIKDIEEAVKYAFNTTNKGDVIISAGSLYMIGSVRTIVNKRNK